LTRKPKSFFTVSWSRYHGKLMNQVPVFTCQCVKQWDRSYMLTTVRSWLNLLPITEQHCTLYVEVSALPDGLTHCTVQTFGIRNRNQSHKSMFCQIPSVF